MINDTTTFIINSTTDITSVVELIARIAVDSSSRPDVSKIIVSDTHELIIRESFYVRRQSAKIAGPELPAVLQDTE